MVIKILLSLVFGFFFTEIVGYFFHRVIHFPITGPLYRAHMAHHLKLYPPEDYLSSTYRAAGAESTTYRFIVAGVVIGLFMLWLLPLWFALPVAFDMALFGFVNSYMHDSLHIRGHWMERFEHFKWLRRVHFQHHVDMGRDFGIITFTSDKVAGTYLAPTPEPNAKDQPVFKGPIPS
jgi:sterol desaturase/sphingolipid hydroxylase (fatty acid hydroxylase superfamily)